MSKLDRIIISVDTKRMKVLVSIGDTFQNEINSTEVLENTISGIDKEVIDAIQEKLSLSYCKLDPQLKWRIIVKSYGYAVADCPIVRISE